MAIELADDGGATAYIAAVRAQAAASVRNLLALELEDAAVGAVSIEADDSGLLSVNVLGHAGQFLRGYSL